MAIVYSYVRFSTRKQLEGDSLRRQVEDGQRWIDQNGHSLASLSLQDLGVSAFRGRNKHTGALSKFVDAIKTGRVPVGSILLVENLDRLSREGIDPALELWRQILRSGVDIAALRPQPFVYTRDSLNDPQGLMMPMMCFHLAYLESKNKSDRIASVMNRKREQAAKGTIKRIDGLKPSWIDWDDEQQKFVPNDGKDAILYIFQKTAEGIGQKQLTGLLQQHYKPIGRSGNWNGSFVSKVLNDRAVLGERQPYTFDTDHNRVPVGAPIVGYYPRIIEDALWYQAQAAKSRKRRQKGPNEEFTNLLVGLIYNANDGHIMHLQRTKNEFSLVPQRRFVSYGHIRKLPGSDSVTVPYRLLETWFLVCLQDLQYSTIETGSKVDELRSKEKEKEGVELRIGQLEEVLSDPQGGDIRAIMTGLNKLRSQLVKLDSDIVELRALSNTASFPVKDLKNSIFALMTLRDAEADGRRDDARELRLRLRSLISEIVESVWIKPEKVKQHIEVFGQINYRSGIIFHFICSTKDGGGFTHNEWNPFILPDLRNWERMKGIRLSSVPTEPEKPHIPEEIPSNLSDASKIWLAIQKTNLEPESYKTIPSKIRQFVDVVGSIQVADVSAPHWDLWARHLRLSVAEGKTQRTTARVSYSRAREFVRWLVQAGKCQGFDSLDVSAASAIEKATKG